MLRFRDLNIFRDNTFIKTDLIVNNDVIVDIGSDYLDDVSDTDIFFANNAYLFPGFIDVHVHLREPGFSYKETIATGTMAAAHGGFTTVCTMPNLNPVPDSLENLKVQTDIIEKTAIIEVIPYGAITKGEKGKELADMEALANRVVAFSDDGLYVESAEVTRAAMIKAKELGKIIASHCECGKLADGGYIHAGDYAKKHGHKGLSSESEYKAVERDIALAEEIGCHYHVCHISCKESVEAVRKAKARGAKVTCEVAAHHVCLDDSMMKEDGIYKMYPPIRSLEDRLAIIEGIKDGTIDIFASDHAPHTKEEKSKGLKDSAKGIVGLETTFPVLYTELVKTGIISLEKLIEMLSTKPAEIFGIGSKLEKGEKANFTIFDLENEYQIDASEFFTKAKFTPFDKMKVYGKCLMTVYQGEIVYKDPRI